MDNNSTDDTDKRNWRERLGVGNKAMPRIAAEFNKANEPRLDSPPDATKSAQPVSVAKPAPMAPRPAAKLVAQDAKPALQVQATPPAKPAPQPTAQSARPMQPASPQSPDQLADKLRSQRAAAEKLAEQRVMAARDRAENPKPVVQPTVTPLRPAQTPASKPKFTFADEDIRPEINRDARGVPSIRPPQRPLQQSPLQPQLSPPRPNLGGDRPLGGQIRPAVPPTPYQPQYRPQTPPPGYRPVIDAAARQPQQAQSQPMQPPRGFNPGPSLPDPRLQQARTTAEPFRRASHMEEKAYPAPGYDPQPRISPRPEALRAIPPPAEDDFGDDIFEEAPPSRPARRASATDYNQAYRENEDGYGDEVSKRSSIPWILLLLLLTAGAAYGGILFYNAKIKGVTPVSATSGEATPVVGAPDTTAKVAPEQPVDTQQNAAGVAPSKKQIYDRIIGDKEILGGQVVPTEEVPVQPANAQQVPQPVGSATQATPTDTAGSGDALPLPMPPPPGATNDTQGALPQPPGSPSVATADPASTKSTNQFAATSAVSPPAPIPEPAPGTGSAATSTQATPPSETAPASEEIITDPTPVKKKTATPAKVPVKPKPKATDEKTVALGAAPVVLVPPAEDAAVSADQNLQAIADQSETPQPAPRKKKTLLGLFNGTNDQVAATGPATEIQQPQIQPTPAAPAQSASAAPSTATGANGYYVQLASFKSQAEANTEYSRLKAKHGNILNGMSPVINPATVGGSTRYRLALGPLGSKGEADDVCNSLTAVGERDCLVRKQ